VVPASSVLTSLSGLAAKHADWEVLALDDLRRRASTLNLPRLREVGVSFRQATFA
jgi:hypothetical protein